MKWFADSPEVLAKYKLSPDSWNYIKQREGWKAELKVFGQILIFTFIAWLMINFTVEVQWPNWSQFFHGLFWMCVLFYGMRFLTRNHEQWIYCYDAYFSFRPKHSDRYERYSAACLRPVTYRDKTLQCLELAPKSRWFGKTELFFETDIDLSMLESLLVKHGVSFQKT